MNTEFLKARQTKYAAYAAVYILVVLTAVVIANFLANRYNKSYDATANKRYSLSDQTAKIVKGLKQDAPPFSISIKARASSTRRICWASIPSFRPKIHVKYVDPDKNPQEAREAGIKNYGTAIGAGWRQKRRSQEHDRRGHHRRASSAT